MPAPPGASDMPYFQGTVLSGARLTGGSGAGAGAAAPPAAAPAAGRGSTPAANAPATGRGRGAGCGGSGGGRGSGEGGGGGGLNVQGLPLVKPPYSRITAIDLDQGEFRWQVPFGATPDNIRNHPALKGLNLRPLGRPGNNVGTLVTKTLLIAGEGNFGPTPSGQRGAMLRAFDKATGQGSRGGLPAGAAERIADDVHVQWPPVHRRSRSAARGTAASCSRSGYRRDIAGLQNCVAGRSGCRSSWKA